MEFDWASPKIFINANASSRGLWRLSAITEVTGALGTQSFHIGFPKSDTISPEVITAILNGTVANAWTFVMGDKRHNKIETCETIPYHKSMKLIHN